MLLLANLLPNFLTRPFEKGPKASAEKRMTCNAIWGRLTEYLKEHGMYARQSVHNTRRGSMLHQRATTQATLPEVAQAAMCSEKTAEYYTDVHRPTRRASPGVVLGCHAWRY